MQKLSVGASIRFGWKTFKKRPFFLIGIVLGVMIVSGILGSLPKQQGIMTILLTLAILVINILIEMGLISFAIKAQDDIAHLTIHDIWHPRSFWKYIGVKILTGVIVLIGIILLIVPGVIAALALMFATYLIIDRDLGPIEAMKESIRLTKGNRWNLFLLILAIAGINILGAIALFVGLFVSIPVSLLALAHAYRTLAGKGAVSVSA